MSGGSAKPSSGGKRSGVIDQPIALPAFIGNTWAEWSIDRRRAVIVGRDKYLQALTDLLQLLSYSSNLSRLTLDLAAKCQPQQMWRFHFCLAVNSVDTNRLQKAKGGLISSDHVIDCVALNSAGLLGGSGTFKMPQMQRGATNLWPRLFQVMTWSSPGSRRESLLSQSVRLTPLGQIESRFLLRDGRREREMEKQRGERSPLSLWTESGRRHWLVQRRSSASGSLSTLSPLNSREKWTDARLDWDWLRWGREKSEI